jgi:hypothetical protein
MVRIHLDARIKTIVVHLNRWQANRDLLSAFTFYNLIFCNDTPTTR